MTVERGRGLFWRDRRLFRLWLVTTWMILSFGTGAKASNDGLDVTVYKFYDGPPVLDAFGNLAPENTQLCESSMTWTSDINFEWGGDVVAGCDYDQVVVHFSGSLTLPERTLLVVAHDDGAALILNGYYWIDQWYDVGCQWDFVWADAGTYTLDFWYYENGGGACAQLLYTDENQYSYEPVPSAWFTNEPAPTTTVEETTTTWEVPTTSIAVETTSTTIAPTTSVPVEEVPPTETTIGEPTPTVTTETPTTLSPTTTSSEPSPTTEPTPDTEPAPETTVEDETTTTSEPSVPEDSVPADSIPEESVPEEITTEPPTEETPETTVPDEEISQEVADLLTSDFTELSTEEIVAELDPEVLAELTDEQISELIENIADAELTDEQAEAIAEALSDAPDEVKQEFESQVDVFSGQFDAYVPLNSLITVGGRRVIIAATSAVLLLPAPTTAGSNNSSKKGRK